MARCPNCARKVRFWHNHSGYCSKQCRTDSITSCPNCGKVGLFKHARLGCCSEECRYWYVSGLLGYDKDALLTPAWDKVVYHVRLPSTSAEISSLQLDELEYDRAIDTVLVVAAPPWMQRSRVLAELPYERFDNSAWQHLWADGTLTEDELIRFHRMCYDDDLLCQKIGEHVYAKLRQPAQGYNPALAAAGYLDQTMIGPGPALAATRPMALPQRIVAQARIAAPALPPDEFVDQVRAIFQRRGYAVAPGTGDNTLLLQRGGRTALATYQFHGGMIDVDPVEHAFVAAAESGASHAFVVTNGHFTLQAEDFAATHPIQLIDGDEMAELAALGDQARANRDDAQATLTIQGTPPGLNGNGASTESTSARTPSETSHHEHAPTDGVTFTAKMPPLDGEIIGGEGTL